MEYLTNILNTFDMKRIGAKQIYFQILTQQQVFKKSFSEVLKASCWGRKCIRKTNA